MRVLLQKVFLTGFLLFAMLSASGILHVSSELPISFTSAATTEGYNVSRADLDSSLIPSIAPRSCQS